MYRKRSFNYKTGDGLDEEEAMLLLSRIVDQMWLGFQTLVLFLFLVIRKILFYIFVKPVKKADKKLQRHPVRRLWVWAVVTQIVSLIIFVSAGAYLDRTLNPDLSNLFYKETSVTLPPENASLQYKDVSESEYYLS